MLGDVIRLMNHFHEGIDELTNKYYLPDESINYKADIEYPLPMIYQSGYSKNCLLSQY